MSDPTTTTGGETQNKSTLDEIGKNLSERNDATQKTLTEAPDQAKKSATEAFDAAKKGDVKTMVSKAMDTLATVTDAKTAVTGALGKISEDIMMPVMKALAPFKGTAILPVAKHLDPVLGCDVHMVVFPPVPAPVPMPHLYAGVIFDPLDWVSILVSTYKEKIVSFVEKNVTAANETAGAIVKEQKDKIYSTVMGLLNLSASVKMGSYIPRAVTGTAIKNIPHFPSGPAFHPAFMVAVKKNHGKVFLGSLFVLADGDPLAGLLHLNYDCWDIGIVDLFEFKRGKKGIKRPKKPKSGGPGIKLYVPSSVILAIPWARVLVNPIPTPFNPLSLVEKILKAGLSKLKQARANKKRPDAFKNKRKPCNRTSRFLHNINNKIFGGKKTKGLHNAVKKAIQKHVGHPVDVATGRLFTDNEDFSLPGPIPLTWERTWYSDSSYSGPLGHGWHHSYDMALYVSKEERFACMRLQDGRTALFDNIPLSFEDGPRFNRSEKIWLHCHPEGFYFASDEDTLIYSFGKDACASLDDAHLLTAIADTSGFAIRFAYNAAGSLTQITDSADRVLSVQNDAQGRITQINAPHPLRPGETFAIASYTYSEAGDMIAHTDALSQPMLFEYRNRLLTKETWRNGAEWYFIYDGGSTGARCIETWGTGNLLHYKLTYTQGSTTAVDSLGHSSTYLHRNGIVYSTTDPLNAVWEERYNEYDELEFTTDPLGNQTGYTHDEFGNAVTTTDPEGAFIQTEYFNMRYRHLPTEAVDAAGGKWKWEYDEAGNLTKRKNPLGSATKYKYNTDGLLHTIADANGATTTIEYDRQYNIRSITAPNGAVTQYGYNILGRCTQVTNPNGVLQTSSYDLLGRATVVHEFDGNIIQLQYDAIDNVVKYTDLKKEVHYHYRGLWKLVARTEGGTTINFKYDTEEQLTAISNENKERYSFELDAAGNVTAEQGFDGMVKRYRRNPAGWVTKVQRPAGRSTAYEYNKAGRIAKVQYHDGSTEEYAYRKDGVLLKASNADAEVVFERDVLGNVTKESSNGQSITSTYDIQSNRTHVGSTMGAVIALEYNVAGDVIVQEAMGWKSELEYDKLGLEVQRSLTGNITSQWQRDAIGRAKTHLVGNTKSNGTPKLHRQYTWSANDQLKQLTDQTTGTTTFEHDKWGNLAKTRFNDGTEQLRNPNAVGNLFETVDRRDRKYDKGGKLIESKTAFYKYDEEGFLIEKKEKNGRIWKYEWNAAGMLQSVVRPDGGIVTFGYDALGRRLFKKYKKTITKFVWDGNKPLHEWKEFDFKETTPDDLITWVFEEDSFAPAAKIKGDKKYSLVCDHLGTPTQGYNEEGSLIWERQLDSYGKVKMLQGDEGFCNYLYQGQTLDAETGLAYNRFRYYDAEEGVYISQDPIGLFGGSNLYCYVNDSNHLIDPLGLNGMPKGGWNYGNMPKIDGYQNHHVIPRSKADHPAIKAAGFDVDKPSNLIYLPKEAGTHSTRSLHDGWNKGHSDYNAHMQSELDRIYEKGQTKGWGQKDYAAEIDKLRGKTKKDLRKGRISCCS